MATGLIEIMKKAGVNAVDASQPCDYRYGTVVSVSPLKVKITNQLVIPSVALITPQRLTNYQLEIEDDGTKKKIVVNNALRVGDRVALLRKAGGQSYFILDRV